MKLDAGEKKWLTGCAIWMPTWMAGLTFCFIWTPWVGLPMLVYGFVMNIRLMWKVMNDY